MAKQANWVITWSWFSETRKPHELILHVIKTRSAGVVVGYMKLLYLNSEFYSVSERLRHFPEKAWRGLIRLEGNHILVGLDPVLEASYTEDLRAERDPSSGDEIVRWTQKPGFKPSGEPYAGQPVERVFRISNYGTIVSDLSRRERQREDSKRLSARRTA